MHLVTWAVAFALMEPTTYAVHRFVMHGVGRRVHATHHRAQRLSRIEANDLFPVAFAGATLLAMAAGFARPGLSFLVDVGIGVSAYGLVYTFVHDVYIHRRVRRFAAVVGPLERLAEAHRIHHLYGGEPYGMLVPIVPADLRRRHERQEQRRREHRRRRETAVTAG